MVDSYAFLFLCFIHNDAATYVVLHTYKLTRKVMHKLYTTKKAFDVAVPSSAPVSICHESSS
jgi:hypothetical protein